MMIILCFSMNSNRKKEILSKKYQSNISTISKMAEVLKENEHKDFQQIKSKQKNASQRVLWQALIR